MSEGHWSLLRYLKGGLFTDPRRGMSARSGLFWGCVGLLVGAAWIAFGIFSPTGYFVGVGAGFLLMSTAELLPQERITLAGFLRLGAMVLGLATLLARLVYEIQR